MEVVTHRRDYSEKYFDTRQGNQKVGQRNGTTEAVVFLLIFRQLSNPNDLYILQRVIAKLCQC